MKALFNKPNQSDMDKISLNLNDLSVDTFSASTSSDRRGTVRGNTVFPVSEDGTCQTDEVTCTLETGKVTVCNINGVCDDLTVTYECQNETEQGGNCE